MGQDDGGGPVPMDEDGDLDIEEEVRDMEAWERAYAEDRSWEALTEDASGLLVPVDVTQQQRQHRRRFAAASTGPRIQRGIIRYLFLVLDFSRVSILLLPPISHTMTLNRIGLGFMIRILVLHSFRGPPRAGGCRIRISGTKSISFCSKCSSHFTEAGL
jgi:hypothetical protein